MVEAPGLTADFEIDPFIRQRLLAGFDDIGITLQNIDDIARFEKMLLDVHYEVIKDFFDWANGNWDASMIQTMLSIGVFLDNDAIFQKAVEYFGEGKHDYAYDMVELGQYYKLYRATTNY